MTDEHARQAPNQWVIWAAVAALGGGSGMGSFIGARGVDDQPSERFARIESQFSALHTAVTELRNEVRVLRDGRVACQSTTEKLGWRVEQCEKRLNEGSR